MRIGELARRTGVPVSAIKYYTREGMLPPGQRTSPNQVAYADVHVRRVRLIRALLEVGGMTVAGARDILSAIDTPGSTVHHVLGLAQAAVSRTPDRGTDADWQLAEKEVAALVARHGWMPSPSAGAHKKRNPGWASLVQIVAALRALDQPELLDLLEVHAEAAARLAAAELEIVNRLTTTDDKVEAAVLVTVLGDAATAALRRIAQETLSWRSVERSPR